MLKSLQTREKPTEQLGKASKGYNIQGPLLHTVTLKLTLLPYSFQEVFLKKASFFKPLTQYIRFSVIYLNLSQERYRIASIFCWIENKSCTTRSDGCNRYVLEAQSHIHNQVPLQVVCHTDTAFLWNLGLEWSQQLNTSCLLAGATWATLRGHLSLEQNNAAG